MAQPTHRAECSLTLGKIPLKLRFKALNLMVLSEVTGKSPIEFFERFEGVRGEDVGNVAKRVCDFSFIVPLIMAGLADNPEYDSADLPNLRRKVCKLLDAEAETGGGLLQVVADVASKLLPAATASLSVPSSETESPNAQAPASRAGEPGASESSVGDG